jgi:predicted nucleic acid-binding protein
MIVVSNTSPITNLAAINHFDLLRLLYQQIHIADAVWDELHADKQQWPGTLEVNQAAWIKRTSVHHHALVVALQRDLDRGEAETIALAIEQKANLVLLDEREGRRAAKRLGLHVTGIVGVLLEAKTQSHIQAVQPLLDRLRSEAGFFLSDGTYRLALELAKEARS